MEGKIILKKISKEYCILKVKLTEDMNILPGQFVMLSHPLKKELSKPFSVMDFEDGVLTFFVKIVGKFSKLLSELKENDILNIKGPLGVPYINKIDKNLKYVLVGGGCGAVSLIYFKKIYPNLVENELYGFKNSSIRKIFEHKSLFIDEESGNPLDKLDTILKEKNGIIFCGSKGMQKALLNKYPNKKIYMSLEENMGCGEGMCKGCPVMTTNGVKMVCKDGPLFDSKEVLEWKD
ncbi:dihydroorotate dehydrogenase [Tepiditoga spiralis]|uniref:Dihydroorotate dehydrogenase n=1 Tax=Tepiditoga spiralis TaxID=2108365 RepID=A0A7G1G729_9BACT|nr:FAD-binding oxidoreductase [Tepiditoga spiralis]BBE32015.1 dihydroorotate dehydrogenase [Tepiditoga spiralis]